MADPGALDVQRDDAAEQLDQPDSYTVHIALFVVTCATTVWAGRVFFGAWSAGVYFASALMGILICHEMGHYVVARRHGIHASLPYFVPLPPFISLGTLGAVIRMRDDISDRNQLIDVGAAGPIAGLCLAVPLLFLGLALSPVEIGTPGGTLEGNSLLYIAAKFVVTGRFLPAADGTDVVLHPVAFAAWVGLLLTMINLIPIGQLDGGHIACAFLGDAHERSSRRLHEALLGMGALVCCALYIEAWDAGRLPIDALSYALYGALPWLVWAGVLLAMRFYSGGLYHPPVTNAPLTPRRRVLVWIMAAIFFLIFTPAPFRPAL